MREVSFVLFFDYMSEQTLIHLIDRNAATGTLWDNGGNTCWFNGQQLSILHRNPMVCNDGYSADVDYRGGVVVNYKYGSFSGQFGTSNPSPGKYEAAVWGC